MDKVGGIQSRLQHDVPAGGMADEMRPLDSEMPRQCPKVSRMVPEADRPGDTTAARIADPVIPYQAVPPAERRLVHEGLEPASENAGMYEYDGLASSLYLVLELDTVKHCAIHGTSSSL